MKFYPAKQALRFSMARMKIPAWALLMTLTVPVPAAIAQQKASSSQPRPAPRVIGRFLYTDGARRLALRYRHGSKSETFTGTVQSTCMLPPPSKAGDSKPLDLSAIRIGTPMTVYYVTRVQPGKPAKPPQNVILSLRFDRVSAGSTLPAGVIIPCFKGK